MKLLALTMVRGAELFPGGYTLFGGCADQVFRVKQNITQLILERDFVEWKQVHCESPYHQRFLVNRL